MDWESWLSCEGEVLWVNEAVERFTGYSPADCLAMANYPLPLITPDHREKMARYFVEAGQGSTENNIEFECLKRDGTTSWVAVSWQPMTDVAGRSLGFRVSVRDISDERKMREQLRLHNEHLEQLVQERTARVAELEQHRLKIHRHSDRRDRQFQIIDCTAIPEALFESVLFGHVKGSFTGAIKDQKGLLRHCDGGTAFLDELGELPAAVKSFGPGKHVLVRLTAWASKCGFAYWQSAGKSQR
ncbi:Transcriptional regulatory protein QseF [Rubripirellula obstinata]|uniref:Transcriptional regulatory protein QseF n=1 Tax=Rubripirellula obstinata TaxID=406547 RepID=A0A5B1CP36_9BACT|nr:Transcriptional regulatory protein QseF [Rubripirellula obstinata]